MFWQLQHDQVFSDKARRDLRNGTDNPKICTQFKSSLFRQGFTTEMET